MMDTGDMGCAFGPVPSRRLGRSLGVNNIPPKTCTYACRYCQVGKTSCLLAERRTFYSPRAVFREVREKLTAAAKKATPVDYLAFVPDGEPTLDRHLGETIGLLRQLGPPVAVITNASLIWRADVRADLARADWVSLKVDTVDPDLWRRLDRPHPTLSLSGILDGILRFAQTFTGRLVTETMLLEGLNATPAAIKAVADFLGALHPHTAYLGIPTRPPADGRVTAPPQDMLVEGFQRFSEAVAHVEYLVGYEGNAFAATGDAAEDLLRITAVHPMRAEAVAALLDSAGAPRSVVDGLVTEGRLIQVPYGGRVYYVRKRPDNRPIGA